MKAGDKVRILRDVAPYPLGFFPAGTTGTVISTEPAYGDSPIALVKLDQHFQCLDEWNNELQVYAEADCYEIVPSLFEQVTP